MAQIVSLNLSSPLVNPLPRIVFPVACLMLLCALAFDCSTAMGQKPSSDARRAKGGASSTASVDEPVEVLRIDTDLIKVEVTAADAAGRLVRGLGSEDFKLYEDNIERPIAFFNVEKKSDPTRPLAVVFVLDTSGSVTTEEMARLRSAVSAFTNRLSERPAVFAVMTFGMKVKTLQSFTSDRQKLDRAFERLAREPEGLSSHAYDAVDDAVRLLVRSAPRTREQRLLKRAVIVITDGFPVGDTVSPNTVIERANQSEVSIYTVTLPSFSPLLVSAERQPLPTPLDVTGMAEKTGGSNIYALGENYDEVFRALADDVTSSYVLAFYPSDEKRRDGGFHNIRIEGPKGLTLRQSRPGYTGSQR
jgi:VWFA-related protein